MTKTAVLLINLGTPDKPTRKAVARFLREFLCDKRVMDIPYFLRKLLVHLIIVPFRSGKSAEMYRQLWTKKGSPILYHTRNLNNKLQNSLPDKYKVFMAMRYGNPSLSNELEKIKKGQFQKLIIIPLFPQYASSTTGSIIDKTLNIIQKWNYIPELKIISGFYQNKLFTKAWAEKIRKANFKEYEHILFSYHGLPERHVEQTHQNKPCTDFNCTREINEQNHACYRAQAYHNTRLLADELSLDEKQYTVCFQSRFGKRWLSPFTEDLIIEKAHSGVKKLLVIPMSFVADCLETIVEINTEYKELFLNNGGNELKMPESLNDDDIWVDALAGMVKKGTI